MNSKKVLLKEDLASLLKKYEKTDVVKTISEQYGRVSQQSLNINQLIDNQLLDHLPLDQHELNKTITSLKENREVSPIIVRQIDNVYEVIIGRRRYYAAKQLNIVEVPIIIVAFNDLEMLLMMFVNLRERRENYALSLATIAQLLNKEYGYSQHSLAQLGHMSRPAISNLIRLLKLDEQVKTNLSLGHISYGHARALINIEPHEQVTLMHKILKNGWSVRYLERLISKNKEEPSTIIVNHQGNQITLTFKSQKEAKQFLKRLHMYHLL